MAIQNDPTIPDQAVLLRVLRNDWITKKGGRRRPASFAFFSTQQEVSYFLEEPGIIAELQRMFPGNEITRVPASVIRKAGFAIGRRPDECPKDFQCDPACHVVAGPAQEIQRDELERCARAIARDDSVSIIEPQGL